jgi:acetyl-CoA C-acetyltransferase
MGVVDDNTPVLVAVGSAVHRRDAGPVPSAVELMADAALDAGRDGSVDLLRAVGWLGMPKGTWSHENPGDAIAAATGMTYPHTVLAEVGILQQTVIGRAIEAVGDGAAAALVVGGEAAHGSDGGAASAVAGSMAAPAAAPDERWTTDDYGLSYEELSRGFVDPPVVYAVIESALAHRAGRTPVEQREHLGQLQSAFAAVTASNPDAWTTDPVSPDRIATPSTQNRLVATPYTKLCCSNLRVDQAAALLFTTVGRARAARIDESQWVFPYSSTESNLSVPVLHRPDLHRSPGAALAGGRALELGGVSIGDVDHLDLYSCFPAAVQVYAAELGVSLDRQLTVTGGMTFAGGPLNNYVLQSTAAMARVLRDEPGSVGFVTSVSGMLTKQGFSLWSTRPPASPFGFADVTDELRPTDVRRSEVAEHDGDSTVVGHTVQYDREGPVRVVAVVDTDRGDRMIAESTDPDLMDLFSTEDRVGQHHEIRRTEIVAG